MFNRQPKPNTNHTPAHRVAFRHQRAIFVFTVLGLIILFSTAVLWGHYETVISKYQWLAKAGLALVDLIAIGLACWHLYARYAPLKVWCYLADAALAVVMVVHAGAVLQLDSSSAQQLTKVRAAAEAQGTIEAARIKAAAEAAAAVKQQTGSTALANRTLRTAQPAPSENALMKMAESVKPETFLSEEYLQGGVYYWPALIALFFFFVAIGISAFALPIEDANHNGVPDTLERFHSSPKAILGFVAPAPILARRPRPYVRTEDKQARVETETKRAEFRAPPKPLITATNSQVLTGKQTEQKTVKQAAPFTGKQVAQPKVSGRVKPPSVGGYVWRPDGSGWELRKLVSEDGQRKQRYISHLGKTEYQEMKREHKGKALAAALAQWVKNREKEKA